MQNPYQSTFPSAVTTLGFLGVASVVNGSVTTNATGANWQALGSAACDQVFMENLTGFDIEVRRGGGGTPFTLGTNSGHCFTALTNASDLEVRRVDQSNTQVSLQYEIQTLE